MVNRTKAESFKSLNATLFNKFKLNFFNLLNPLNSLN